MGGVQARSLPPPLRDPFLRVIARSLWLAITIVYFILTVICPRFGRPIPMMTYNVGIKGGRGALITATATNLAPWLNGPRSEGRLSFVDCHTGQRGKRPFCNGFAWVTCINRRARVKVGPLWSLQRSIYPRAFASKWRAAGEKFGKSVSLPILSFL